jgi:hypothetical protein
MCSIAQCDRPLKAKGLCSSHYQRWKRLGDPLAGGPPKRPDGMSQAEAFAWFCPGSPPSDGCWDWPAGTNEHGYGIFGWNNHPVRAHIVSHGMYNPHDPVTAERPYVLHSCDRPICVQPAHLRAGTPAENMADGVSRHRWPLGETHYHAKLTDSDVLAIRSFRGQVIETELADRFGVARTTIADILHGRTWQHLL